MVGEASAGSSPVTGTDSSPTGVLRFVGGPAGGTPRRGAARPRWRGVRRRRGGSACRRGPRCRPHGARHALRLRDEQRCAHPHRGLRTPGGLGVRAEPSDVVTSAQAGARMLAERLPVGSHVLVIGGPGVGDALRERGLEPVESVDDGAVALMQGYGPDVGWRQLAEGSLAIGRGLLWVATNLDRTIPTPRGRVLGNGSMVEALRHATGAEPLVAGKPEPPLMIESVQRSRRTASPRGGGSPRHRHRGRQPFKDPLAACAHRCHGLAGPPPRGAAVPPHLSGPGPASAAHPGAGGGGARGARPWSRAGVVASLCGSPRESPGAKIVTQVPASSRTGGKQIQRPVVAPREPP